jgi:hypothetical protein
LLLVTADAQILVDASSPRFQQLRDAFKITPPDTLRFKVSTDHPDRILWVTDFDGPIVYAAPRIVVLDDFLKSNKIDMKQQPIRGPPIALEPSLLEETGLAPDVIGLDTQVHIIQVELTPEIEDLISRGVDLVHIKGQDWRIISRGLTNAGGGGPSTPVPAHPAASAITLIYRASACKSVSPELPCGTPTPDP